MTDTKETNWSDYDKNLNFGKEVYILMAELETRRDQSGGRAQAYAWHDSTI
jgi:hypothetical protein